MFRPGRSPKNIDMETKGSKSEQQGPVVFAATMQFPATESASIVTPVVGHNPT